MRPLRLIFSACLISCLVSTAAVAAAQEASVMTLKLESTNADPAVVSALEASLAETIEEHPEMTHAPGGEVTVTDLATTAGCVRPDETCMKIIRDFVDADRVVFGSVEGSGGVHEFDLKMFDFSSNRFVATLEDQSIQGSASEAAEIVPHLVDGFLYGTVGELVVEIDGEATPDVSIDGKKVGTAPATLQDLPLGQHVVTVRSGSEEYTETVVLKRDEPATLSFRFAGAAASDPIVVEDGTTNPEGPSLVPGIVALGIGAVGFGVAIVGGLQVLDARESDEAYGSCIDGDADARVDLDCATDNGFDDFLEVQRRGRTGQTLNLVGLGVGVVGVGLGTFLIIRALGADEGPQEARRFDFEIAPTRGGIATSVRLRF